MKDKLEKNKIIPIVTIATIIVIVIVSSIINNQKADRVLDGQNYIIEQETDNSKDKNKFFIKDNKLYFYNVIGLTQSLTKYSGNIYEIGVISLK